MLGCPVVVLLERTQSPPPHQQQQPATCPAQSSTFAASTPTLVLVTLHTSSNGEQSLCYRCWVWVLARLTPHFFTFPLATVRSFVATYLPLAAMGQARHRKYPFSTFPSALFSAVARPRRNCHGSPFSFTSTCVLDDTAVQRLGSTSSLPTTKAGVTILKLFAKYRSRAIRMVAILANAFFRVTHSPAVLPLIPEYELRAQRNSSFDRSLVTPLSSSASQEMRMRHLTTCKWTRINFPRDWHLFLREGMGGTLMDPV